jgi:hypothetical protein
MKAGCYIGESKIYYLVRVADVPIVDIGKEVGLCFSKIYDGLVICRRLVV